MVAGRLRITVALRAEGRLSIVALAVAGALAIGCVSSGRHCRGEEQPAIVDSLYFGTAMPGGLVSKEEWQGFLAEVITPRFPEGLTAWSAAGQWQDSSGELQREDSYVLHVVHRDEPRFETAIHEVIETYKTRFRQEAVLRVRTATCISF
jgi:hypothetical protein